MLNLNIDMNILGTLFFSLAVIHTFAAGSLRQFSHRFPKDSVREAAFHMLGEVEVVFGLWAGFFLTLMALQEGTGQMVTYLESVKFTEPLFVFVIMTVCATRPVTETARHLIVLVSRVIGCVFRTPEINTEIFVILTLGPLAGSFITEPAAMTVTALLLASMIHTKRPPVLYALLAVLFVNVSIGGALTPYAAPPILMVAQAWGWDFGFVIGTLGWKAAVAVVANALLFVVIFRNNLSEGFYTLKHLEKKLNSGHEPLPVSLTIVHFLFLLGVIIFAHHESVFIGIFLFFIGVTTVSKRFQTPLRLKESLLVAFFLGGIIVFGPFQKWWLQPLLASLGDTALFVGAAGLTAITDNAALTFLGSQVPDLSAAAKYALVAGALAGGGLTVIANAPNPAGYSILSPRFPEGQIKPVGLLVAALVPTAIAMGCFWFLP